ncbi:PREDICTED: cysteine-rich repeat secretory protein 3 [Ipomoea nil]|uniref:cysteine-rich repeat secretory protein 3 n=1 Tax=Ipomoea nil TaxID=35883 RepID=UPI0009012DF1|nr:PREDICTED: cysteine-rich repeat secretory protein 3 [Ipomoea nil]XP_019167183.1 PREDICTED: cysteine-rich repeat secretory protein 3 [Ipomoea nil]
MGQSRILSPFSLVFLILGCFFVVGYCSDYKESVFKGCANQKSQDGTGVFSQNLETLFETLVSQSSAAKFYKTAATGGGGGQSSIAGLFQCRGDLSASDCSDCVQKATDMSKNLCGDSIAGRIQLVGCYIRYEVSGFRQVGPTELLYKLCGSTQASGSGFDDRVETALGEIAKGVETGNGFYTAGYQSVFVLGQCEGDLGSGGDCVNCVKNAAEKSKSSCGSAISAQIYLQQCYISYTYYPNGVPTKPFSSPSSSGTTHNTQKTVAIILGGLAGVGLVLACLLFTKSAFKKKTHSKYYGG